jgi:hypothetical protein
MLSIDVTAIRARVFSNDAWSLKGAGQDCISARIRSLEHFPTFHLSSEQSHAFESQTMTASRDKETRNAPQLLKATFSTAV